MTNSLLKTFSKSRAEEYPNDLWGEFVIPPLYTDYSCLFNYTRAVMIEGGRGSGKTMFLKYHCHKTRFSKKRNNISSDELRHIGLYFRPDTDFCSMINEFNFGTDWRKVFTHYLTINLLSEFISAISSITNTHFNNVSFETDILSWKIPDALKQSIEGFPSIYRELSEYCSTQSAAFNLWINDPESFQRPKFLEPRTSLYQLILQLKENSTELKEICFYIYFDEFENLNNEQQKVINNWIKHGEDPIIFNCAYKHGAKVSRETSSDEKLVLRNDYRVIDLGSYTQNDFTIFAAEVLCLKLSEATKIKTLDNIKNYFCNENLTDSRKTQEHQKLVTSIARKFLPSNTYSEIAHKILNDETLKGRLERFLIAPALLKESDYQISDFVDLNFPEESLINGLLLNRTSYTPAYVKEMFDERKTQKDTKNYKSLIDQNLVGSILWIYLSASWKQCPVYSGFDSFCFLSRGNMRHFLELCHQTISVSSRNVSSTFVDRNPEVDIDYQAEGATNSSRLELEKIDELGKHGEKLRFIVNRLGLFFQLLQKRKSQSETEVNHFSIKISDENLLDETTKVLLDEAVIWSILIKAEGDTKRKGTTDFSSTEYMLHPIFSPHFGISYRRKKKFEFTKEQLETIFSANEDEYKELCMSFSKRWDLKPSDLPKQKLFETGYVKFSQKGLWD